MTPAELIALVELLEWTWKEIADYVVRDERTVRRWKDGEAPIPKKVVQVLDDEARLAAFDVWLQLRRKK